MGRFRVGAVIWVVLEVVEHEIMGGRKRPRGQNGTEAYNCPVRNAIHSKHIFLLMSAPTTWARSVWTAATIWKLRSRTPGSVVD